MIGKLSKSGDNGKFVINVGDISFCVFFIGSAINVGIDVSSSN